MTKTDKSLQWLSSWKRIKEGTEPAPAPAQDQDNNSGGGGGDNSGNQQPQQNSGDQKPAENQKPEQNNNQEQKPEQSNQIDPAMVKELNDTMKTVLEELKRISNLSAGGSSGQAPQQQQAPAQGQPAT